MSCLAKLPMTPPAVLPCVSQCVLEGMWHCTLSAKALALQRGAAVMRLWHRCELLPPYLQAVPLARLA